MPSLFSVQPPAAFGALVEHSWSLLPDPSALPWSRHGEAGGSLTPTTQKKGKNPSALGAGAVRAAKNLSPRVSLLAKSSREASPKIPQEEAASLTTQGGFSLSTFSLAVSPPPLQENQNLSPPASLEPSQLHFSPTSLETQREREKRVGHTQRRGWKTLRYHFPKVEDWWTSLDLSTLE